MSAKLLSYTLFPAVATSMTTQIGCRKKKYTTTYSSSSLSKTSSSGKPGNNGGGLLDVSSSPNGSVLKCNTIWKKKHLRTPAMIAKRTFLQKYFVT